ncbi:hypothetical protein CA267_013720 [Alteromonas pelagimontana]|uniref:Uncharacterized protein n=1 Tax=Alteromonas pelagimontana TaxID=1858656 RepID=A0A6M4MF84_9ALTE|nr:DUF6170 family protein [Alteromonas pelagimontana]QJR81743.1 hypothetical protein CA267_013720 [Alteromonas pelagimontana]
MALFFTTRHIPQLQGLPLSERMQRLEAAARKMTAPEKTFLNVLKLLIIVPVFALILRTATDWSSLIWAGAVFLLYPSVVKPIQYSISAKYLPQQASKE